MIMDNQKNHVVTTNYFNLLITTTVITEKYLPDFVVLPDKVLSMEEPKRRFS